MGLYTNVVFVLLGLFTISTVILLIKCFNLATAARVSAEKFVYLNQDLEQHRAHLISVEAERDEYLVKMIEAQNQVSGLSENVSFKQSQLDDQLNTIKELRQEQAEDKKELMRQSSLATELQTKLNNEISAAQEKIALLKDAEKQMSEQFKNIATEILDDKSKKFTEQNQANLNSILEPLKERIVDFKTKVEQVYDQEGKERTALGEQVRQLMELNNKLSSDANNLTNALKGNSKVRGNWGEMILEKVLETAGLRKGIEYDIQESHTLEDRSRLQPDVVIHLPEGRHIVIDSKVSLVAYDAYASANDDAEKAIALKRHIDSVRSHIKGLSSKSYQNLYGLQSLDFVMMFIPIEPAFMVSISEDSNLWHEAWQKNVILVSPSTLLFVVRTVAHLWKQEHQNKNAQEIAQRGAALYDKFVGFVEDLEKVGDKLSQTKLTYDNALGKLSSGNGNLIRQAEMLRELGVKSTKQLSESLIAIEK
jgi:DNA recombination protein RmuC